MEVRRRFQEGRSLPTGGLGEERYLPARRLHQARCPFPGHTLASQLLAFFILARSAPPPLFQFSELTPNGFQEVAGATL